MNYLQTDDRTLEQSVPNQYDSLTDEELALLADEVFLMLDRDEQRMRLNSED